MKAYMCTTDFEEHLNNDYNGVIVYPSVKAIQEQRRCVQQCGVTEVEVVFVREITPSKIMENLDV